MTAGLTRARGLTFAGLVEAARSAAGSEAATSFSAWQAPAPALGA